MPLRLTLFVLQHQIEPRLATAELLNADAPDDGGDDQSQLDGHGCVELDTAGVRIVCVQPMGEKQQMWE